MDRAPLADRILGLIEHLPQQLQAAARYVLDNPRDVALLSMRDQARLAGVQPATMTRLAQRLGFRGYDEIRVLHADAVRTGVSGFSSRAGIHVTTQKLKGERALAAEMVNWAARQIARLSEPAMLDSLAGSAKALGAGRRIYCVGLRASFPVAWHFHYILSLLEDRVVLVDAVGGTGIDALRDLVSEDILFAVSVAPYTRVTVDVARYASDRGSAIVAVTDSEASPLARLARHLILVATDSPSFLHGMTPAFAAVEILAALVAGNRGDGALAAVKRTDDHLAAFGVHAKMARPYRKRT